MTKSSDKLDETIKISQKIINMHKIKKIIYFFNKYKMLKISAETHAKNYIYTTKVNKKVDKEY